MVLLSSAVFSLVLGLTHTLTFATSIPVHAWVPEVGDSFYVDTKANMGYLMHADGVYTDFPVVTGKKAFVHYIGRSYRAETPSKNWVAKSLHFKGDRITFGAANPKEYKDIDGAFLRLYIDGVENSPYGIHPNRNSARMFAETNRYESMGCVIVSDAMMRVILETWRLNGEQLVVVTRHGLETKQIAGL